MGNLNHEITGEPSKGGGGSEQAKAWQAMGSAML